MDRHSEQCFGNEALKTPPSIYGEEVSAKWNRTYSGDVIMTVRMPLTLWTQKSASRLLEDTQESRWTHGCLQPGRRIGPPTILPIE